MDLQLKGPQLILVFLGIIILSGISCSGGSKDKAYEFGKKSRLVNALIPKNCNVDNLTIYNEYYSYRLSKKDYELVGFSDSVGLGEKVFSVFLKKYVDNLSQMRTARISICENGKVYIGLPILEGVSSYPPECHFCFRYDSLDRLKINDQGKLYLGSVRYITQKNYDELLIPIN